MTDRERRRDRREFAPVESAVPEPLTQRPRPDARPLQRAWGAAGAAASSALLAAIVGPVAAAAVDGGFSISAQPEGTGIGPDTDASAGAMPTPNYVFLQPGEIAPEGAPVVRLDPITVVTSPVPGSTTVQAKPERKVVYIYLKPGQTPPPGAIVRTAGTIVPTTPQPTPSGTQGSGAGSGGSSATPKPPTPTPSAPPPVSTPKPTPVPTPPPTKPSGP